MSKYSVGLEKLLLQGLSEPEFYGEMANKFRKIIDENDFPYYLTKITLQYKKIGYSMDVLRQTTCACSLSQNIYATACSSLKCLLKIS